MNNVLDNNSILCLFCQAKIVILFIKFILELIRQKMRAEITFCPAYYFSCSFFDFFDTITFLMICGKTKTQIRVIIKRMPALSIVLSELSEKSVGIL